MSFIRQPLLRLALTAGLVILGPLTAAGPARAQLTDVSQVLKIEVIPGWRRDDGTQVAGLRFKMRSGWKTYWRSAGAAGISPQMDWRGSGNARSITPAWPTPRVFGYTGGLSIGYDGDFVLPLLIKTDTDRPVTLHGRLNLGVCADICLPARFEVRANLPPARTPVPVIEKALRDQPRPVASTATCRLRPAADGLMMTGQIDVPTQGGAEAVVFELPDPSIWVTDAVVTRDGGRLTAQSELISAEESLSVDRSRIKITVIGERSAVEMTGCRG